MVESPASVPYIFFFKKIIDDVNVTMCSVSFFFFPFLLLLLLVVVESGEIDDGSISRLGACFYIPDRAAVAARRKFSRRTLLPRLNKPSCADLISRL